MRELVDVIDEMVEHIPKEHHRLEEMLRKIQADQRLWTAPENMVRWEQTSEALQWYCCRPNPTEEWHFIIFSIWADIPVEEIKKMLNIKE